MLKYIALPFLQMYNGWLFQVTKELFMCLVFELEWLEKMLQPSLHLLKLQELFIRTLLVVSMPLYLQTLEQIPTRHFIS